MKTRRCFLFSVAEEKVGKKNWTGFAAGGSNHTKTVPEENKKKIEAPRTTTVRLEKSS